MTGLDRLATDHGIRAADVSYFTHGTTVGINTVIQRNGPRMALFTTPYGSHAIVGPALDGTFRAAGLPREVAIQVATSVAAAPLVAAGLGVGPVDGLTDWPGLIRRPFHPATTMSLTASTASARPVSRLAKPFLAALRARL